MPTPRRFIRSLSSGDSIVAVIEGNASTKSETVLNSTAGEAGLGSGGDSGLRSNAGEGAMDRGETDGATESKVSPENQSRADESDAGGRRSSQRNRYALSVGFTASTYVEVLRIKEPLCLETLRFPVVLFGPSCADVHVLCDS